MFSDWKEYDFEIPFIYQIVFLMVVAYGQQL